MALIWNEIEGLHWHWKLLCQWRYHFAYANAKTARWLSHPKLALKTSIAKARIAVLFLLKSAEQNNVHYTYMCTMSIFVILRHNLRTFPTNHLTFFEISIFSSSQNFAMQSINHGKYGKQDVITDGIKLEPDTTYIGKQI